MNDASTFGKVVDLLGKKLVAAYHDYCDNGGTLMYREWLRVHKSAREIRAKGG